MVLCENPRDQKSRTLWHQQPCHKVARLTFPSVLMVDAYIYKLLCRLSDWIIARLSRFLLKWPVNVYIIIPTGGMWDCIVNLLSLSGGPHSVFLSSPTGIFPNSNEACRTKELLLKRGCNEKELA